MQSKLHVRITKLTKIFRWAKQKGLMAVGREGERDGYLSFVILTFDGQQT
jgi:hypothetical protein